MQVILRTDVEGLGYKGDLVEVADGHARNLLIPNGRAFPATKGAVEQAAAMRRSRDQRDAAERADAEETARSLVATTIRIEAKVGDQGRLFGSVTSADIADAVGAQTGVLIDRKDIQLAEPVKEIGVASVQVQLHREVEFPLTFEVVGTD